MTGSCSVEQSRTGSHATVPVHVSIVVLSYTSGGLSNGVVMIIRSRNLHTDRRHVLRQWARGSGGSTVEKRRGCAGYCCRELAGSCLLLFVGSSGRDGL